MGGQPVHLSAREFDLLLLLAERAGMALHGAICSTRSGDRSSMATSGRWTSTFGRFVRRSSRTPTGPPTSTPFADVGYRLEPPAERLSVAWPRPGLRP